MRLSATFDEEILKHYTPGQWINFCCALNIRNLEVSPHPSVLPLEGYKTLLNLQQTSKITTTFHVPYFAKKFDKKASAYDLVYYKESPLDFKDQYNILFHYIKMSEQSTLLTLHGAKKMKVPCENTNKISRDMTWFGLEYLLGKIHSEKIDLTLCIELSGPESPTYLTKREEIEETIKKFQGAPLKICWDIPHDEVLHTSNLEPSDFFKNHIGHVHLHGMNKDNQKHLPLKNSILHYEKAMQVLHNIHYKKAIVLELLTHTIGNGNVYLKSLANDIKILTNLI